MDTKQAFEATFHSEETFIPSMFVVVYSQFGVFTSKERNDCKIQPLMGMRKQMFICNNQQVLVLGKPIREKLNFETRSGPT